MRRSYRAAQQACDCVAAATLGAVRASRERRSSGSCTWRLSAVSGVDDGSPRGQTGLLAGRSVPPGRPGPGVGVKKINVRPYSPPAKLKPAGATLARAILDSPDRAESKIALASVAPAGTGYEQAVTSQTLVHARGIFVRESLS
jgi:hypothetical protein